MKLIFTLLIAVVLIAMIAPPATAGSPCVINCPSMSPACVALSLARCGGGWIDGSVIWMWQPPQPFDERPVIEAPTASSRLKLPDDGFQVYGGPPKKDHIWGGETKRSVRSADDGGWGSDEDPFSVDSPK